MMQTNSFEKIIPRARPRTSMGVNIIFYVVLTLFGLLIVSFFLLKSQAALLQDEKEALAIQVLALEQEAMDKGREVLSLTSDMKLFKDLLAEHRFASQFFPLLESITHPQVQILQMDLNLNERRVSLNGLTKNFKSMGEQILVLREKPEIGTVHLSELGFSDEGKVTFSLSFYFPEEIIKP